MESVMVVLDILRRALSRLGPYVAVEIVLPGGTLVALLLYLYRRQASIKSAAGGMSNSPRAKRLEGDGGRSHPESRATFN